MRSPRLASLPLALTAVNLVLLAVAVALALAGGESAGAQPAAAVVRARAFELVDARGTVRASLRVEADPDTSVLRLQDEHGTIRVKVAATADGSGVVLLDDRTELGVQIGAREAGTFVKVANRDGGEQLLRP